MPRTFFIGDIHGCSKTFEKLLLKKINIRKTDKIYCLGDYVDRGNDSKGVIDLILELRKENYKIHTLRGNHELMLLESVKSDFLFSFWLENGGGKTLKSFKVQSIKKLDPVYLNFIKNTKYYIRAKDFIAAHAGINFDVNNPLLDKEAMLWIRDYSVDKEYLNGRILIHGHTPKPKEYILSQSMEGAINLDGGCVYTDREDMGNLFALDFNEKKFISVGNIE